MSTRSLARLWIPFLALAVASFAQAKDPEPETVAGKRYRIVWLGTGEDLAHGGGRWVHEIFLPEQRLVITLVPEERVEGQEKPGEWPTTVPCTRAYVRAAEAPRNDLTGIEGKGPSKVEDVRVPAALVKEWVTFAELSRRYEAEGVRLGGEAKASLALADLPRTRE